MSDSNQRKFQRVNYKFNLDVEPSSSQESVGHNISPGGLLFPQAEPISLDTIVDMTLAIPGLTGSETIKGKVLRCDKDGERFKIAINFVDLDEESQNSIIDMLRSF